jgi:predicted ABC-type ATPase
LKITPESLINYFATSQLLINNGMNDISALIKIKSDSLYFHAPNFNSYHASVLSDYLRRCALQERMTFSFETVMSSPDKVDLLRTAQSSGYRTYLYFVATADPKINIQRVKNRVATGGHDVPINKIVERYHRSLDLLTDAIAVTNRTFLFDTSGDQAWYFAEVTDGDQILLQVWDIAEEN